MPYIFFEEDSYKIRKVYKQSSARFNEAKLPKNTVGIYYNLLDIIGNRLKNNPEASLVLTGTTDGQELNDRSERISLARFRANEVANYFIKNWNIDRSRLNVEYREIPDLATSLEYKEGYEENRRVEISSSQPGILKPVLHSRFLEYTSNKDALKVEAKIDNWNEDLKYNLMYKVNGEFLASTGDQKANENVNISIPRNKISEIGRKMNSSTKITADLKLYEGSKLIEKKVLEFDLNKRENNFEVGRLNLIVFDFDKAVISDENRNMIQDFISRGIQSNSKTTITGSTDRLGEARYNTNLSQRRADAVSEYILGINPSFKFDSVKGIGSSNLPFSNETPEGRFYCRTVLIEVETPIEK